VTPSRDRFRIDVVPEDPEVLLAVLRRSLARSPREIPPRYFYDDTGSRLFEEITALPEYYPTRTEERILAACAEDVAARTGAGTLVELGSGAATKTRLLLDAMRSGGRLRRYIPFDVSEGIVRRAADELLREYPDLSVHAVVADFAEHLDHIPPGEDRLCIFLGGTIGNFRPAEAVRFLRGWPGGSLRGALPARHGSREGHRPARGRLQRLPGGDGGIQPQRALRPQPTPRG